VSVGRLGPAAPRSYHAAGELPDGPVGRVLRSHHPHTGIVRAARSRHWGTRRVIPGLFLSPLSHAWAPWTTAPAIRGNRGQFEGPIHIAWPCPNPNFD
jgi:hypothetical protein